MVVEVAIKIKLRGMVVCGIEETYVDPFYLFKEEHKTGFKRRFELLKQTFKRQLYSSFRVFLGQ